MNAKQEARFIELIEELDEAAWSAGSESGQGVCDQGSHRAEAEANARRVQARAALIEFVTKECK